MPASISRNIGRINKFTHATPESGATTGSNGVIAARVIYNPPSVQPGRVYPLPARKGTTQRKRSNTMNENDIKKLIEKKKAAFAKFDAMTPEEQRKARERGEDPHESKVKREKRKAANLAKEKREFDKLPKERRDILTALGVSPYQRGQIINRSTSYFEKHGSYIVDNPPGATTEPE